MGAMASQITGINVVYSTVYSGADQRKTLKLRRVIGLCAGNSPVTAENVSIWWRHHDTSRHVRLWIQFAPNMMTSSNGNIFRVTGPLCGEFTGPGEFPAQRPVTRSFDVFFDLCLNKRLSKQPWGWWFETPAWSLWRHRNGKSNYYPSAKCGGRLCQPNRPISQIPQCTRICCRTNPLTVALTHDPHSQIPRCTCPISTMHHSEW